VTTSRTRRSVWTAAALSAALPLAACGGGDSGSGGDDVEIKLAHSYTQDQPQHRCGAQVIADTVKKADAGMTVKVYPNSQLGEDADRISSVVSGDIDMDIQGASALGAVHEPISVVDAAYAFDDGEHFQRFFSGTASEEVTKSFADETGVEVLGAWSAGARQFTANEPIREPSDLDGLRMRFPDSPQYLTNAKALGAKATSVAYEELYLALQQGTVDGQENPIVNIDAVNLQEVQSHVSMSDHQINSNLVIIGEVWQELSAKQRDVLGSAVDKAVEQVPGCVAEDEKKIVQQWEKSGDLTVVDDVDVDAFRSKAQAYLRDNLPKEQLAVYEDIRGSAG
jgi:TRAP-type transport system periplasmic protein